MTIADKTVLVTGANRGIGQALVEEALRQGPGVLSLCPIGEVGPGGMELVWSGHELP